MGITELTYNSLTQTLSVYYLDTFAPVVRMDSLRAILGIKAMLDLEIRQFEIKSTYLNGDLEEEVYMKQAEGNDNSTRRVMQLRKAIYSLKQAGRVWYNKFSKTLKQHDFHRQDSEHCVYFRRTDAHNSWLHGSVNNLLGLGL